MVNARTCSIIFTVALLILASGADAETLTVMADGSGEFATIQDAANAAHPGDEVVLMPGTYTGPGNKNIRLFGKAITVRSHSGQAGAVIIDCESSPSNAQRAFVLNMGEGTGTVLQGLTIRNGYGSYCGIVAAGALLIQYSSPVVRNCVFEDNHAGMSWDHAGGAVYVDSNAHGYFENCVFRNNSAYFGGAVGVNHFSTCEFVDCRFYDNVGGRGGAVWGNSTTKTRCVFARNSAEQGGAIWGNGYNEELSISCTYHGNGAVSGGTILSQQGYGAPVTLIDTVISGGTGGGAILAADMVTVQMSCSNLYGNEGGDYTGHWASLVDVEGNFSANPCYCDPDSDEFTLSADSYCLPGNHPWGCHQLVGALGEGCAELGCTGPVSTQRTHWGGLKALYR